MATQKNGNQTSSSDSSQRHEPSLHARVIRYMGRMLQEDPREYFDSAGCVNYTALAEAALWEFPEDLEDGPEADVWDWAIEAADIFAPDRNQ